MTPLEARVAAMEQDIIVLCTAIQNLSVSQTLIATYASTQLGALIKSLERLRDSMQDGDEWRDFG